MEKLRKYLREIRYWLKGQSFIPGNFLKINKLWIGNTYGGFYVHPDLLNNKSIVYSFGVGEDISFDTGLINNYDCTVFAFDPTPKSIRWIEANKPAARFNFYPYGISSTSGKKLFHLPKNQSHVSGSVALLAHLETETIEVPMKCLKDIASELNHSLIDVLKMDIEGSEYDVLSSVFNSGIEIKQILVEFHHRMFPGGGKLTKRAVNLLKEHGFELYACSETAEELSFINKKFL